MWLNINGEKVEVPETIHTVADVLKHFELEQRIVIIELDQHIIDKSHYENTEVQQGSRMEIVHFVGGG
ncbi:sulfur carrier protein ThiS [Paenibacillus sp. N1-5-1-14]|uniref:sulfur carrier protein ThiS n=1 Tax=Paenibacillus radicibacter TaxID=2972488 RepID=UPI0021591D97|nr:sulfur carrier protein ThiS [Paenibacillus radicibacter]MCR8644977.1 sulfur carrier protein ThiS [Paenibacillus radicibacter]